MYSGTRLRSGARVLTRLMADRNKTDLGSPGAEGGTARPAMRRHLIHIKITIPCVVLIVLLGIAADVRFTDATKVGVPARIDSEHYLKVAQSWVLDGVSLRFPHRPVSSALQALSIKLFGYNDYSLRILNSSMDMLNLVLIFVIGVYLLRSFWLGLIPVALYAFNPYILEYSRNFMVHVLSETFVLLSFLFFILYESGLRAGRRRAYVQLAVCGLCLGAATLTHMDLAFLGLAYAICLALISFLKGWSAKHVAALIRDTAILTFGFLIPLAADGAYFGFDETIKEMKRVAKTKIAQPEPNAARTPARPKPRAAPPSDRDSALDTPGAVGQAADPPPDQHRRIAAILGGLGRLVDGVVRIRRYVEFSMHTISQSHRGKYAPGQSLYPYEFWAILPIILLAWSERKMGKVSGFFPLILILVYITAFCAVFGELQRALNSRFFIPLFPLFLIAIVYWYQRGLKLLLGDTPAEPLIVLLLLGGGLWHWNLHPHILPGDPILSRVTPAREIHNILGTKVNHDNQLLVTPWIFYDRRGFHNELYFGPNATYIGDVERGETLDELVDRLRVKYLFFSKDRGQMQGLTHLPRHLDGKIDFYNLRILDALKYSTAAEKQLLDEFLFRRGAIKVHESHLSLLYQLRDHTGGPQYRDRFKKWDFGGAITVDYPMTWTEGAVSQSMEHTYKGKTSLKITADGTQPWVSVWTEPIFLGAAHSVTAGTWLRPARIANGHLTVWVEFFSADGTIVGRFIGPKIRGPLNKWRFHTVSLDRHQWSDQAFIARVGLTFKGNNNAAPSGMVFMGNLSVTLGGAVAPPEEVDREPGRDVALQGTGDPR